MSASFFDSAKIANISIKSKQKERYIQKKLSISFQILPIRKTMSQKSWNLKQKKVCSASNFNFMFGLTRRRSTLFYICPYPHDEGKGIAKSFI